MNHFRTSLGSLLLYALLGTSRHLMVQATLALIALSVAAALVASATSGRPAGRRSTFARELTEQGRFRRYCSRPGRETGVR